MKNSITKRLSLRARFKSTKEVEIVIIDENNQIQIELIPIKVGGVSGETLTEEVNRELNSKENDTGTSESEDMTPVIEEESEDELVLKDAVAKEDE